VLYSATVELQCVAGKSKPVQKWFGAAWLLHRFRFREIAVGDFLRNLHCYVGFCISLQAYRQHCVAASAALENDVVE
jgi:hypothetical protein